MPARGRDESGALVYTPRNIEDLKVGDRVLARDEFGEAIQLRRVTETVKRTTDRLRVLTFESSSGVRQTLRTTDEHPFWTVNHHEFRPASWLEPGDTFIGPDGQLQTLTATESESHPDGVFVYNVTVEVAHTYFVGATKYAQPLLVHNADCANGAGGASDAPKGSSWSASRRRYWKGRAGQAEPGEFSPSNVDRMRGGKPPLHDELGVPKELHHRIPQREGGSHLPQNLREVWPWEHEAIDPFRYYNGPRPPGA